MSERFRHLIEIGDYQRIADDLLRLENERGVISLALLSEDPEAAIASSPEVELEYQSDVPGECAVYGFYRAGVGGPSSIVVNPSLSTARDRFTIVHEYGHHVQRQHRDWADARYALPAGPGDKVEERVANAFAAAVLIPDDAVPVGASLNARTLAQVHGRLQASRSAVASRAVELAPDGDAGTVVVFDCEGRVVFARASNDEVFTPARGIIQPGLAAMFEATSAAGGHLVAPLPEGLHATSGWTQADLTVDVAVDITGGYAFAVLRPTQVFGRVPVWELREAECPNPACEATFVVDGSVEICDQCNEPKCPECSTCSCEPDEAFCTNCGMAFSAAERAGVAEHECL